MSGKPVSILVVRRLPRYYRFLGILLNEGINRISSGELAERMSLTASQIRQDLNCFGGFGQQGYGYNVELLRNEIGKILGLDIGNPTILIGVGNIGRAIINHMDFESRGCRLTGVFDNNKAIVGQTIKGFTVMDISMVDDFCKKHQPVVAILCTPEEVSEGLAKTLVDLGIKGFWNFSHYDIAQRFPHVAVENVHLGDSLMTLSYKVKNLGKQTIK